MKQRYLGMAIVVVGVIIICMRAKSQSPFVLPCTKVHGLSGLIKN